jgi:hypothetical protein
VCGAARLPGSGVQQGACKELPLALPLQPLS